MSLRIALPASPAEARARTNPASTSVSNAAVFSALDGSRSSHMSRTSASVNPHPLRHGVQTVTGFDRFSWKMKPIIGAYPQDEPLKGLHHARSGSAGR